MIYFCTVEVKFLHCMSLPKRCSSIHSRIICFADEGNWRNFRQMIGALYLSAFVQSHFSWQVESGDQLLEMVRSMIREIKMRSPGCWHVPFEIQPLILRSVCAHRTIAETNVQQRRRWVRNIRLWQQVTEMRAFLSVISTSGTLTNALVPRKIETLTRVHP